MPGALVHSPADIVRRLLISLGHGTTPSANLAWPIFASHEPITPDQVITLYDTYPRIQGRTQDNGEIQEHYGLNFRIRASNPAIGFQKCNEIAIAVDQEVNWTPISVGAMTWGTVTIPSASYIVYSITRMTYTRGATGFLYLGKEREVTVAGAVSTFSNRDIFSLNGSVSLRQT